MNEDPEYKYFLSVKNICESCGYDHEAAGVTPIIIMEQKEAGAFCRNCHANMHPEIIMPSMKKFTEETLKDD